MKISKKIIRKRIINAAPIVKESGGGSIRHFIHCSCFQTSRKNEGSLYRNSDETSRPILTKLLTTLLLSFLITSQHIPRHRTSFYCDRTAQLKHCIQQKKYSFCSSSKLQINISNAVLDAHIFNPHSRTNNE